MIWLGNEVLGNYVAEPCFSSHQHKYLTKLMEYCNEEPFQWAYSRLIYRHLTRTILIRTFQRTSTIYRAIVIYICMWRSDSYRKWFEIIFLTHGNWSHYTHFFHAENKLRYIFARYTNFRWSANRMILRNHFALADSKFAHYAHGYGQRPAQSERERMGKNGKTRKTCFFKSFLHSMQ